MGVIRQARSDRVVRDAIVLDLGDLRREGDAARERARAQAAAIIREGEEERRRLIAQARDEGLAQGREEGLAQGREEGRALGRAEALEARSAELERLAAGWGAALDAFEGQRAALLAEARRDVLLLACAIAERIVKRSAACDPGVVASLVEEVLTLVAGRTRLTLRVAEQDLGAAKEALPALLARLAAPDGIELVPDAALPPGSCVARTPGGGAIDASIHTQLDRIARALVPAPPGPGAAP